MVLRFCGIDKPIVPDHQNFDTKNIRHTIGRKKGPKIIGKICLDAAKVLFFTKEIEDPVLMQHVHKRPQIHDIKATEKQAPPVRDPYHSLKEIVPHN